MRCSPSILAATVIVAACGGGSSGSTPGDAGSRSEGGSGGASSSGSSSGSGGGASSSSGGGSSGGAGSGSGGQGGSNSGGGKGDGGGCGGGCPTGWSCMSGACVSGQTCPAAPGGTPAQAAAALATENKARAAMGVPCASIATALDTASADHCAYYAANAGQASCIANPHVEVSGCSMYVAAQFYTRDSDAGYTGQAVFEDMAFEDSGQSSTQEWIDSIWHRTPVLSPWILDLGYGGATGCDTADFGVGAGGSTPPTTVGTYPYDDQTGVPTSYDGNEGPAPPAPPGGWPSGYPVTLFLANATVTSHTLTAKSSSTAIAHQWIAPGDPAAMGLLQNDYVMYANTPLSSGTTYVVSVEGTQGSSKVSLTWSFTTE